MTTREFLLLIGQHPLMLVLVLGAVPVLAWVCGMLHGRGNGGNAPWKYLYSVLVYAACVPGIFAAVLLAYTLFFIHENLLDVNLLVYVGPIVSMALTLLCIQRNVNFDNVPGFDRLAGLMVLIGVSFASVLAIDRTHIFIGFFASIYHLFILAAFIFALLKWGAYTLFRRREDPARELPRLQIGQ